MTDPPVDVLSKLDVLILWFGDPAERSVRFLASCLRAVPNLPVLGVTTFDTDHVVDLLKCGMGDHMSPPLDAALLNRKLERLLSKASQAVVDTPVFKSLRPAAPPPRAFTKRSCARAPVSPVFPATATIVSASGTGPKLDIRDIAVLTDDRPGGLALRIEPAIAPKLQVHAWTAATFLNLHLHLPAEISKAPIWTRARVVRVVPPTAEEPYYTVAFQYWVDRVREEPLVQKFWIQSQQLELLTKRRKGG